MHRRCNYVMNVANKNQMEEIYRFDHLYKLGFSNKISIYDPLPQREVSNDGRWYRVGLEFLIRETFFSLYKLCAGGEVVVIIETRQNSTQGVGNMPPPSPRHLLPHVLQIMPRNPKYDQFQPKGHHNEENPQSTTKMPGNAKFDPFH